MRDQEHDLIDLAVDVGSPLRGGVEPRTLVGEHAFEVSDDLVRFQ